MTKEVLQVTAEMLACLVRSMGTAKANYPMGSHRVDMTDYRSTFHTYLHV